MLFVLTGLMLWGVVRGAAVSRSPAERAALDDEQARILAESGEPPHPNRL